MLSKLTLKPKLIIFGLMIVILVLVGREYHQYVFNSGVNSERARQAALADARRLEVETLRTQLAMVKSKSDERLKNQVAKIDQAYQQGIEDAKVQYKTSDIIEHAAQFGGLSIDVEPTQPTSCDQQSTGATSPASSDNDQTRARLSEQASRFLIAEAKRADAITAQLGACQRLSQTYYEGVQALKQRVIELTQSQ